MVLLLRTVYPVGGPPPLHSRIVLVIGRIGQKAGSPCPPRSDPNCGLAVLACISIKQTSTHTKLYCAPALVKHNDQMIKRSIILLTLAFFSVLRTHRERQSGDNKCVVQTDFSRGMFSPSWPGMRGTPCLLLSWSLTTTTLTETTSEITNFSFSDSYTICR